MQVGVGMCMEGIEHNPIVYELMSEMAFRDEKVKINVKFICYSALYKGIHSNLYFTQIFHFLIAYVIHVVYMLCQLEKKNGNKG